MKRRFTILVVFLIVFPLLQGQTKIIREDSLKINRKLGGILQQLSLAYEACGVRKMADAFGPALMSAGEPDKQAIMNRIRGAKNPAEKRGLSLFAKILTTPKFRRSILLQGNDSKWVEPKGDIGGGIVESTVDPMTFQSKHLKVLYSFESTEIEGLWIGICEFSLDKAEEISRDLPIERLYLSPEPEYNNDLGGRNTWVHSIRKMRGGQWSLGYTGKGVIVGLVDSGIDITHGDFIDPVTGTTRILYIWDTENTTPGQTASAVLGLNPLNFDYGTVWTKAQIDAGLCTQVDTNGHGTHTSGTAAGNGNANGRYTGMAPRADIVFVKGLDPYGWEFIMEVANQLGKHCVINNSWGIALYNAMWGYIEIMPGDGTDWYSQYIRYLQEFRYNKWHGNVLVKSAGNDGHNPTYNDLSGGSYPYLNGAMHAEGVATTASPVTHVYTKNVDTSGSNYVVYADFAYRSDVPLQLTFNVPGIGNFTFQTGGLYFFGTYGVAAMFGYDPYNGEYCGYIWFDDFFSSDWPTGDYQITVQPLNPTDTVTYDLWCDTYYAGFAGDGTDMYSNFSSNYSYREYILDWGACPDVITVASHNTRQGWTDINGSSWTSTLQPILGDLSDFSSVGPMRNTGGSAIGGGPGNYVFGMKPEISAPGQFILSAATGDAPIPSYNLVDSTHQRMQGTSMAAPFVTGGIALMMQKANMKKATAPSVSDVKTSFNHGTYSLKDDFVNNSTVGRVGWGYGKFHVWKLNDPPVCVLTSTKQNPFQSKRIQLSTNAVELNIDDEEFLNLDISQSTDFEEFSLSYHFELTGMPDGASPGWDVNGKRATLAPDLKYEGEYTVRAWVNDSLVDSEPQEMTILAKSFPPLPPLDGTFFRKENSIGFFTEYIDVLAWTLNPENRTEITQFRIYRKTKGADDSTYVLDREVAVSVTSLEIRGLAKDDIFTYRITSVNFRGKESEDGLILNK